MLSSFTNKILLHHIELSTTKLCTLDSVIYVLINIGVEGLIHQSVNDRYRGKRRPSLNKQRATSEQRTEGNEGAMRISRSCIEAEGKANTESGV